MEPYQLLRMEQGLDPKPKPTRDDFTGYVPIPYIPNHKEFYRELRLMREGLEESAAVLITELKEANKLPKKRKVKMVAKATGDYGIKIVELSTTEISTPEL